MSITKDLAAKLKRLESDIVLKKFQMETAILAYEVSKNALAQAKHEISALLRDSGGDILWHDDPH